MSILNIEGIRHIYIMIIDDIIKNYELFDFNMINTMIKLKRENGKFKTLVDEIDALGNTKNKQNDKRFKYEKDYWYNRIYYQTYSNLLECQNNAIFHYKEIKKDSESFINKKRDSLSVMKGLSKKIVNKYKNVVSVPIGFFTMIKFYFEPKFLLKNLDIIANKEKNAEIKYENFYYKDSKIYKNVVEPSILDFFEYLFKQNLFEKNDINALLKIFDEYYNKRVNQPGYDFSKDKLELKKECKKELENAKFTYKSMFTKILAQLRNMTETEEFRKGDINEIISKVISKVSDSVSENKIYKNLILKYILTVDKIKNNLLTTTDFLNTDPMYESKRILKRTFNDYLEIVSKQ